MTGLRPPPVRVACGLLQSQFLDAILMESFPDQTDAPRWIVTLADHRGFDLQVLHRRLRGSLLLEQPWMRLAHLAEHEADQRDGTGHEVENPHPAPARQYALHDATP